MRYYKIMFTLHQIIQNKNERMNNQVSYKTFAQIDYHSTLQQNRLISLKNFKPGDKICHFSYAEILTRPNRFTLQIGEHKHIILNPAFLEFVNHSCEPNAFFNTRTFEFECLKPIAKGEEFTFFYPSTEWELDEPFYCHCKSPFCLGKIEGAKYLPKELFRKYRLSAFIEQKLQVEFHGLILH